MTFDKILIGMGLFLSFFGCGINQDKKGNREEIRLEEITSRTDTIEGFIDIFLSITSDVETDTSHIYIGEGLYKGEKVGLKFELSKNISLGIMPDGKINSKGGFMKSGINVISIGTESDRLLSALGELYEVEMNGVFKERISPTIFSLNQKVANLEESDYYLFKLFFNEDGDEESYCEMFFNLDTGERIIELHEKDPEYRIPLINTFTKK